MKFLHFLVAAALTLSAVEAMPATLPVEPIPDDPVARLDFYRAKIQRYETPIVQTYLARAALNGAVPREASNLANFFAEASKSKDNIFSQRDDAIRSWLKSGSGQPFDSLDSFPPATNYITPVVLPQDAVLDKPVVGKGIFPIGRRPQDEASLIDFVKHKLQRLPQDDQLDLGSTVLLDASLLQLLSARILLGYDVGLAKFDWQKDSFCKYLTSQPMQKDKIVELLTDGKQQVRVLSRVQRKAESLSQVVRGDAEESYPEHTASNVLRLFQAYVIPVTIEVELATIIAQAHRCKK
ncbi:hypothetical protein NDA16_003890 [Ustilago loliicola]|nr:hypothetical protein NDA16_003890 [Ustilago loliicola]